MRAIEPDALRAGDRRALAKAITLVESQLDTHRIESQSLLQELLPHTGNSIRIGITGVPGVGKSTFIEAFGLHLVELGHKVAILAVDPSSPVAGGSILGDKTRMEHLSRHPSAYIRPSPAAGALGGVAQKTRETMLLCEAAGYDIVLVETVGVGQSEYQVAGMVDFFMALMLPNAGDELQGLKKGIMELVDALIINKADGESVNLARMTQKHYTSALTLLKHVGHWSPQVMTCSALEGTNIDAVWSMLKEFIDSARASGAIDGKRSTQAKEWMHQLIDELLQLKLSQNASVQELLPTLENKVVSREVTAYSAARQIINCL